jgi:hypothetical protein
MRAFLRGRSATSPIDAVLWPVHQRLEVRRWRARAKSGPAPHLVKRRAILDHAKRYGLTTFIETGTYLGDMVSAVSHDFQTIHTIELDPVLYETARRRFRRSPHIHVHKGDSARVLPGLVSTLSGPALFWLDGHYSGSGTARGEADTPIQAELRVLLQRGPLKDVILIDDARLFTGANGYPDLASLQTFVTERGVGATVQVADDLIRITPSTT